MKKKTSGRLLSEIGEKQTAGPVRSLGDKSERQHQRVQRHIRKHDVGRTENRFLLGLGLYLGLGHAQIEMRMLSVTDRIFTSRYIDGAVRHHVQIVSAKHPVFLLSGHVPDSGLIGLEIIEDVVHGVGLAPLSHLGLAGYHSGSIRDSGGIDHLTLDIVFHIFRSKFHISV